jgi:hypothetical protein
MDDNVKEKHRANPKPRAASKPRYDWQTEYGYKPRRKLMTKAGLAISTILGAALFCGVALAQEPVEDINKSVHPVLAAAQHHVVEANNNVTAAQKDNRYDMQGHAEKARDLLVQANNELKAAAQAADASRAAGGTQKKK